LHPEPPRSSHSRLNCRSALTHIRAPAPPSTVLLRARALSHTALPYKRTATTIAKLCFTSDTYCRHTFPAQSRALENTGRRETKFGLATIPAVRSFSRRSPQILGIFADGISGREICPVAEWRRERDWERTLSAGRIEVLGKAAETGN
jgi:hypothetical protein